MLWLVPRSGTTEAASAAARSRDDDSRPRPVRAVRDRDARRARTSRRVDPRKIIGTPCLGAGFGGNRSAGSRRRLRLLGCPQQPLKVIADFTLRHGPSKPTLDDRDYPRHGEPQQHRPPADLVDDEDSGTCDPEPEAMKTADERPQPDIDHPSPHAVEDPERAALVREQRGHPPDGKSGEDEQERLCRLPFEHLSVRQHGSDAGGHGPVTVQPYGT